MGSKKDYSKDPNFQHYLKEISGLVYGYSRYGRLGGGKIDRNYRGRVRVEKRVEALLREVDSWK